MPNNISAYVIYNGATNTYLGASPVLTSFNCAEFGAFTPKFGYLKRRIFMGVAGGSYIEYLPTFSASDPEIDANTLQGVFVQQNNQLVMLDAASVQAVIDVCDNCCDGDSTVTRYYGSSIPIAFTSPTTTTYYVTRTDDGTPAAVDQFSLDYMDQDVLDPIHVRWVSGTSTYTITAFGTPTPVGSDVISS